MGPFVMPSSGQETGSYTQRKKKYSLLTRKALVLTFALPLRSDPPVIRWLFQCWDPESSQAQPDMCWMEEPARMSEWRLWREWRIQGIPGEPPQPQTQANTPTRTGSASSSSLPGSHTSLLSVPHSTIMIYNLFHLLHLYPDKRLTMIH